MNGHDDDDLRWHRRGFGLLGLALGAFCAVLGVDRLATYRALPAAPAQVRGAALLGLAAPRYVIVEDGRWGLGTRVRQADGLNVPIHDASGRLVAVALVEEGEEEAFDDTPWGVAEPLGDSPGYLDKLAEKGLEARVPGIVHLHARRRPSHYLLETVFAGAVLLLGATCALALLPPGWLLRLLLLVEGPPGSTRGARVGGVVLLGVSALCFLLLVADASWGLSRVLLPLVSAVAGLGGLVLLVAPPRCCVTGTP